MGCFGFRVDDFIDCAGVENIILKCNSSLNKYHEMMNYIDACRLFDKPMLEYNAIRHFIFNLQDRFDQINKPLWSKHKFELYQKFVIDHRHCGLIVKLSLYDETALPLKEPESIKIKSSEISPLKLIRGGK
jgi:hypothetical protein